MLDHSGVGRSLAQMMAKDFFTLSIADGCCGCGQSDDVQRCWIHTNDAADDRGCLVARARNFNIGVRVCTIAQRW